jgi:putative FmdB family regulatory protein
MPFYEFECPKGHITDHLQKMPGKESILCPICSRATDDRIAAPLRAKRILSPTPTTFVSVGGRKL